MFSILFALFVGVPLLELWVLLRVSDHVGAMPTLLLVIGTGVVGASLARREGLRTLAKLQASINRGEMPQAALLDGMCIFMGGALLLTPGILTDALGFSLLFPLTRPILQGLLARWVEKKMQSGHASVSVHFTGAGSPPSGPNQRRSQDEKYFDQSWD